MVEKSQKKMDIEEEKKKLSLKKSRIEARERFIKEKERKIRTRKLIELGGIVVKSGVQALNNNQLLGALIQIRNQMSKESNRSKWKEEGAAAFEKEERKNGTPLIVSFEREPERDIKEKLRDLGLRWNRFRREWEGCCDQQVIKKELEGRSAKITVVAHSSK